MTLEKENHLPLLPGEGKSLAALLLLPGLKPTICQLPVQCPNHRDITTPKCLVPWLIKIKTHWINLCVCFDLMPLNKQSTYILVINNNWISGCPSLQLCAFGGQFTLTCKNNASMARFGKPHGTTTHNQLSTKSGITKDQTKHVHVQHAHSHYLYDIISIRYPFQFYRFTKCLFISDAN